MNHQREFYVVIERDENGYYVGEVPQLRGCYSQGETIDELMKNIREVIELCLEDVGFQSIRHKGSHLRLKHEDGRVVTVPVHRGKTVGKGLLLKILRDAELTQEEFIRLL
ncbi:MAG: addiction module toxin, HicA family [Microcystis aeruginosa W13-18]|nr:addiction module toxin, HicA family [Microcystis aeruginosa W13-18]